MKRWFLSLSALLLSSVAFAGAWNTWQQFQPGNNNVPVGIVLAPPTAPSGAAATQTQKLANAPTWTDNSADETGFEVEVNINGAGYNNLTTTAANVTSYTHTNVTIGSSYVYRMRAVGAGGNSAYSTASAVVPTYRFGYPTFGPVESGVLVQWAGGHGLGSAAVNGAIVDSVSGISLAKVGSPTYDATATGNFAGWSPGVTMSTGNHFAGNATSAGDIGTNDFVLEIKYKTTKASGFGGFWSWYDGTNKGTAAELFFDTENFNMYIEATDGTAISKNFALPTGVFNDGNEHKIRCVGYRSTTGNAICWFDGVQGDTEDISSLAGKTIKMGGTSGNAAFIGFSNGNIGGTIFEIRVSTGTTANSGGPGGG